MGVAMRVGSLDRGFGGGGIAAHHHPVRHGRQGEPEADRDRQQAVQEGYAHGPE
jgi:hypothetical protein